MTAMPAPRLRRRTFNTALGAAAALPWTLPRAQPTPSVGSRPLRLLNGFPAGGATDAAARLVASGLEARLGERVTVENVVGAAGTIAAAQVARAEPDGRTLLFGVSANLAVAPALRRQPPYEPPRDFTPVIELATGALYWFVAGDAPARTMPEFIAWARREPGRLNYGTPGVGSLHHLATEMLLRRAGIEMLHVPYPGRFVQALLAGEVQGGLESMTGQAPLVADGRLRALASTGTARHAAAPDVPTFEELGLGGIEARSIWGIVGPRGLPPDRVARLHGAIADTLAEPATQVAFMQWHVVASTGSPQDFGTRIRREWQRWQHEIDQAGLQRE